MIECVHLLLHPPYFQIVFPNGHISVFSILSETISNFPQHYVGAHLPDSDSKGTVHLSPEPDPHSFLRFATEPIASDSPRRNLVPSLDTIRYVTSSIFGREQTGNLQRGRLLLACIKMRQHDSNRRHYRRGVGCKHVVMYSYWPGVLHGPQSEGSSSVVIFEF